MQSSSPLLNVLESFSLANNVALVTGSTQGLGFEIARGLASAGATVIVHGRNENAVNGARLRLENEGFSADGLIFDINDNSARNVAFTDLLSRHGSLDILVNNAGTRARKPMMELSAHDMQAMVQNNLLSTIEVSRQAAQVMRDKRKGRIVTITSLQGHLVRQSNFIYPLTKQALETMTRVLAAELGSYGIRCNSVAPGTFATEFNQALIQNPDNTAMMQKRNPTQRWGRPEEIVGPVIFLASEASSYVNGQTLLVDGGFSISF